MKRFHTALLATLLAPLLLAGCERPPMDSTQTGFRGTAMGAVQNPRIVGPVDAAQKLPDPVPAIPSPPGSPLAKDSFKNVQVLGDLPAGEFTRTMLAITAWVAPKEGCAYCHKAGDDLSADTLYTKVVARKMIAMTRHINTDWKQHVAASGDGGAGGVTCYTCHRGQPVPARIWFTEPAPRQTGGSTADSNGQNRPAMAAGLTALGIDPLTPYLLGNQRIRAAATTALPVNAPVSIQQTEKTFGLMMHMSQSLGVNCTYCHNTRSHAEWAESPPTRTTAFHGINMARDLNVAYMLPLTQVFPPSRLGPTGDVAKVSCATCHQGQFKPLKGAPLLKDHPALGAPLVAAAAGATSVPSTAVAQVATQPAAKR
ncbi:MAG: photosynthetic reaction center cytochrome PufC [Aquabacterium sp.]|nr:photosynthetic reaction center cytochrome PufC [Aquabacterium sp.]